MIETDTASADAPPGSLLSHEGRMGVSPKSSKLTAMSGTTLWIACAQARHVSYALLRLIVSGSCDVVLSLIQGSCQ